MIRNNLTDLFYSKVLKISEIARWIGFHLPNFKRPQWITFHKCALG